VNVSAVRAVDLAAQVGAAGVRTVIYTDISKDGMMAGPNFAEMAVMGQTGLSIIASGGVSSLDDIRRLMTIPGVDGAILGKALYTGAVDLKEALQLCR
jgi:phosphoribosylformimino-5-aminoimidazole carboxamide ribotide isomerase